MKRWGMMSSIDPGRAPRVSGRRVVLDALIDVALQGKTSSLLPVYASRVAVDECTDCPLRDALPYSKPVPWSGPMSSIMIVGEAPGADEDRMGFPFVGRAGQMLSDLLAIAGADRSKIAFANTVSCRPPRNRYEFAREVGAVDACRHHLEAALDASHAWIVVSAGGQAAREFGHVGTVGSAVGKWQWKAGRLHVAIWHPAYVLRQGGLSSSEAVRNINVLETAVLTASGIDRYVPAAPFDGRLLSSIGEHERDAIRQGLQRAGWVPIWSRVLDRNVVVYDTTRHETPAEFNVPPGLADPLYLSLDELARLRSHDDVRRIAAFKDAWPEARVVA